MWRPQVVTVSVCFTTSSENYGRGTRTGADLRFPLKAWGGDNCIMQKEKKSQKSHEMKFCLRGRRQEFFHLDQQLQKN